MLEASYTTLITPTSLGQQRLYPQISTMVISSRTRKQQRSFRQGIVQALIRMTQSKMIEIIIQSIEATRSKKTAHNTMTTIITLIRSYIKSDLRHSVLVRASRQLMTAVYYSPIGVRVVSVTQHLLIRTSLNGTLIQYTAAGGHTRVRREAVVCLRLLRHATLEFTTAARTLAVRQTAILRAQTRRRDKQEVRRVCYVQLYACTQAYVKQLENMCLVQDLCKALPTSSLNSNSQIQVYVKQAKIATPLLYNFQLCRSRLGAQLIVEHCIQFVAIFQTESSHLW